MVEWPSEKKKPTATGRLPSLHQLARHVVDRGDVVGVDGVAQAEAVGEEGRAEQDGMVAERDQRPDPGQHIGEEEDGIDARHLARHFRILIVEQPQDHAVRCVRQR